MSTRRRFRFILRNAPLFAPLSGPPISATAAQICPFVVSHVAALASHLGRLQRLWTRVLPVESFEHHEYAARFVSSAIYNLLLHFTGVPCWYSCSYRNKMRVKFNLFGSPWNDCLVHSFCESCALCQEYRELKHLGYRPALGWKGNLRIQERKMGASMAAPACPTMAK